MADQVFVARERELNQLNIFLDEALAGHGQVCFVTGEAGTGKTALVTEFARRAQAQHEDLLVAIGVCNAQTGIGDPYLPFREVLSQLTADVGAGAVTEENASRLWGFLRISGKAVVDYGPDLIDIFVPGTALASRVAGRLAQRTGWMDRLDSLVQGQREGDDTELQQSRIFEQYANVLKALAMQQPLILLLDDVQWADTASIALLFHLGRQIGESRILLVSAYRPDEVVLGRGGERHPLEKVLAEFKRYFGDICVDLGAVDEAESQQFVDALLDVEPNQLGEDFRQALLGRTRGHPLFTSELLRDMRERGALLQDEGGRWVEGRALDWGVLPVRVEGVIEERIGRLEPKLRELLSIAAVEGEVFAAQTLAQVQDVEEREVITQLAGALDRRHHLVSEKGIEPLNGQRLYHFGFRHTLFRQYLYDRLSPVERELLHGDVGQALERLYAGRTDEIAVQLSHHWLGANKGERAIPYLLQAGDRARALYVHAEAEAYYQQAIQILQQYGQEELLARTLLKLGLVYTAAFEPEKAQTAYSQAFSLWEPLREVGSLTDWRVQPPAVLRLAAEEPLSLDPGKIDDDVSTFVAAQLFEGLVRIGQDYNVLPSVAARWEVADQGTRYTFYLQEDLYWSDGTPVTAGDFEYAWKRNLDPATQSAVAHLLYAIQNARAFGEGHIDDPDELGVMAEDDLSLVVRLEQPTAYFPYLLAQTIAYPVPQWTMVERGEDWAMPGTLIGNGPYELEEWERGERLVLKRNRWYGGRFPGNAERVDCKVITNYSPGLELYAAGRVDGMTMFNADPDTTAWVRANHGRDLVSIPRPVTFYLVFRTDCSPFDDVRVRQAFVHAIDRVALTRTAFRGERLPATGGFVPPNMPGHSPDIGLAYDPGRARCLLSQAGYPSGRGFPEVSWLCSGGSSSERVVSLLATAWRSNLGLTLVARSLAWGAFMDKLKCDPGHLSLVAWSAGIPDPDDFLRVLFHSTEGLNYPRWHNARFDALVEEAARVIDPVHRMELYQEADRILVTEESAIMPLSYGQGRMLVQPWVSMPPISSASMCLKNVVVERKLR